MAADEVHMLADAKKLALVDRCSHPNWKARSAAFDEIAAACSSPEDSKLSEYAPLFVKAVADANAAAQDKALDALNAFLARASEQHIARMVDKTCANMVSKALNGRTGTVQRALEAMLQFIELEQSAVVVDALIEGLKNKVPKVVVASIDGLIAAIGQFGVKVILPQPILKAIPEVADSKDGKARDKAKELVVELSRWMGPDIIRTVLFKNLRDAVKEEVERGMLEVAKLGKAQAERFTRCEQTRRAALQAVEAEADGTGQQGDASETATDAADPADEEGAAQVDPYDVVDPKDVLKELDNAWWEKLASKKWSDRKEALAALRELASYPRLAAGRDVDYGDVNRELRKIIVKDSNVMCVAEAVACTGVLAQSIRGPYSATARGLVETLLEKLKEKNAAVGKAVSEALHTMHKHCFTLLDVSEQLTVGLNHASPKVKEETLAWLKAAVASEDKAALVKLVPLLLAPASKCAEEATPSLREAALVFMTAFAAKFGSTTVLDKFTGKMDDARKKKLAEMVAEATGAAAPIQINKTGGLPGPVSPVRPLAQKPSAAAAALAASRTSSARPLAGVRSSISTRPVTATAAKPGAGGTSGGAAAGKKGAKDADLDDESFLAGPTLSRDEALARLTEFLDEACVKQLQDPVWKERLAAMEKLLSLLNEDPALMEQGAVLVQAVAQVPGWAEKNFQVMAKQFDVLRSVASGLAKFSKRDAFVAITGVLDKMSDVKLKGPACDTLTAIAEAVGPAFVSAQLHKKGAAHTSPKVLSEVYNWISQAMLEFGLQLFNVKSLLQWAKEDLQSANAGVRNSAIIMLGVMHRFLGAPLGDMIRADIKPALMAAIEGEFAKNAKHTDWAPTRSTRADLGKPSATAGTCSASTGAAHGGSAAGSGGTAQDMDELLPRSDLSELFYGPLIGKMGNSVWKERKEALDEVEAALISAGGRIQPQLGELVPALKLRMADSNKNLVAQALQVIGKLARAVGRAMDKVARPLLGPALKNLSDNKATVRAAVSEMLTAWASVAPLDGLLEELREALSSPKCTADGKAEGINWLTTQAVDGQLAPFLPLAMHMVALGTGDKMGEVREATAKLTSALLKVHTASQLASAAANGLEPAARKLAVEAVTKAASLAGMAAPVATSAAPSAPTRPSSSSGANPMRTSTNLPSGAGLRSSSARGQSAGGVRTSLSLNKPSMGGAKPDPEGEGPLLIPDHKKEARAVKGKHRPAKLELRPDEATTLEAELTPLVSAQLRGLLFTKDFKKHCEAADLLREALPRLEGEVVAVLDLLFRWCTLRILEANTQTLVKVLDLLKDVMAMLEALQYRLSDFEVKLILPVLVEKAGHNQDKIKADHRELLKLVARVVAPVKVAAFIKDGLESKNNKTRVVCADELGALIDRSGPSIYNAPMATPKPGTPSPEGLLLVLARLVLERDTALRSAALGALEMAYAFEGDGFWRYLSKLPKGDAVRALVEERFKYTDKDLAKKGLAPGHRSQTANQAVPSVILNIGSRPITPRASFGGAPASLSLRPNSASVGGARPSPTGRTAAAPPPSQPASMAAYSLRGGSVGGGTSSILANMSMPRSSGIPSPALRGANGTATVAGLAGTSQPAHEFPAVAHGGPDAATAAYLRSSAALPPGALAAANGVLQSPVHGLNKSSEAEMRQHFRQCVQVAQGTDLDAATEVLKMLTYELMGMPSAPPTVEALFLEMGESLMGAMPNVIYRAFQAALLAVERQEPVNGRACKYALNLSMSYLQSPRLAPRLSLASLQGLHSVLFLCLVDQRINQKVPDGFAMLKAVDHLLNKSLVACNKTAVCQSLLSLLLKLHPAALLLGEHTDMEFKWSDLVIKCLIKVTKTMHQVMQELDLPEVLLAIHTFFSTLGPIELGLRSSREDRPLRMVKTVLFEVCKVKGLEVYKCLGQVPGAHTDGEGAFDPMDPSQPVIVSYISVNLSTLMSVPGSVRQHPAAASNGQHALAPLPPVQAPYAAPPVNTLPSRTQGMGSIGANDSPPAQRAPRTPAAPPMATQPDNSAARAATPAGNGHGSAASSSHQSGWVGVSLEPSSDMYTANAADEASMRSTLGMLLNRMSQKDAGSRNQVLVDMYHFTMANPDIDINMVLLSSASDTFRKYVETGLNKVRTLLAQQQAQAADLQRSSWGSQANSPDGAVAVTASLTAGGPGAAHSVTALKLTQLSFTGAPGSPASPGLKANSRTAPVVGESKMAELRAAMQDLQQNAANMPVRGGSLTLPGTSGPSLTSSVGFISGGGAPPSAEMELPAGPVESGSLAELQARMKMLKSMD